MDLGTNINLISCEDALAKQFSDSIPNERFLVMTWLGGGVYGYETCLQCLLDQRCSSFFLPCCAVDEGRFGVAEQLVGSAFEVHGKGSVAIGLCGTLHMFEGSDR